MVVGDLQRSGMKFGHELNHLGGFLFIHGSSRYPTLPSKMDSSQIQKVSAMATSKDEGLAGPLMVAPGTVTGLTGGFVGLVEVVPSNRLNPGNICCI